MNDILFDLIDLSVEGVTFISEVDKARYYVSEVEAVVEEVTFTAKIDDGSLDYMGDLGTHTLKKGVNTFKIDIVKNEDCLHVLHINIVQNQKKEEDRVKDVLIDGEVCHFQPELNCYWHQVPVIKETININVVTANKSDVIAGDIGEVYLDEGENPLLISVSFEKSGKRKLIDVMVVRSDEEQSLSNAYEFEDDDDDEDVYQPYEEKIENGNSSINFQEYEQYTDDEDDFDTFSTLDTFNALDSFNNIKETTEEIEEIVTPQLQEQPIEKLTGQSVEEEVRKRIEEEERQKVQERLARERQEQERLAQERQEQERQEQERLIKERIEQEERQKVQQRIEEEERQKLQQKREEEERRKLEQQVANEERQRIEEEIRQRIEQEERQKLEEKIRQKIELEKRLELEERLKQKEEEVKPKSMPKVEEKVPEVVVEEVDDSLPKLQSLRVDGAILKPAFSPDVYKYTLILDGYDVDEIEIHPEGMGENTKVIYKEGKIPLKKGSQTFDILAKTKNAEGTYSLTLKLSKAKKKDKKEKQKKKKKAKGVFNQKDELTLKMQDVMSKGKRDVNNSTIDYKLLIICSALIVALVIIYTEYLEPSMMIEQQKSTEREKIVQQAKVVQEKVANEEQFIAEIELFKEASGIIKDRYPQTAAQQEILNFLHNIKTKTGVTVLSTTIGMPSVIDARYVQEKTIEKNIHTLIDFSPYIVDLEVTPDADVPNTHLFKVTSQNVMLEGTRDQILSAYILLFTDNRSIYIDNITWTDDIFNEIVKEEVNGQVVSTEQQVSKASITFTAEYYQYIGG